MEKKALVYTGKAKKLYQTENAAVLFVEYLDQATALNGQKKDKVLGKGALNNQITSLIFEHLQQQKIPNHFIKKVSEHEQLIQAVEMIPLEVVVRNYAAGSFSKRLAIEEGTKLVTPIIEFYYKEEYFTTCAWFWLIYSGSNTSFIRLYISAFRGTSNYRWVGCPR